MIKPPRQVEREKCIICLEWNLPEEMYTPFICKYCVNEDRIAQKNKNNKGK